MQRWEGRRLLPVAVAGAFLIGLGVFAYFARVAATFPGEVRASVWVQSWRQPWLDTLMKAVSVPGLLAVAGPLALITAAALYLKRWRAEGVLLLVTVVAGRLITLGLKEVVARPRPPDSLVKVLQEADNYSFPSGHVMHYAVFLGILVVILATKIRPSTPLRLVQGGMVLLLIAIGLSRIYLGVHWLGDVVGGYAFGAAVVACAAWLWRGWRGRSTQAKGP